MLRFFLVLSCAVTGLLGACPAGYKPMGPATCYKIIYTANSARFDLVHICPEGYTEIENPKMCFRLSDFKDTRTYQSAVGQCRRMITGRLVDLDTPEKYGIVAGYLTALGAKGGDSGASKYRVWVGLKRSSASVFKWTTGSTKVPAWGKGEPDNIQGQDCGQLDSFGLSDISCGLPRRYVCEVPLK